jgi:hypothetical protein
MFEVPVTDTRLKNKAEVVVLRPGALGSGALVSATGEALPAVPTHRVFWFGWIAQHPSSALIR